MKGVILFSLCLVSVPGSSTSEEVQIDSFTGGGILIFCKYDVRHEDQDKPQFFCKGNATSCPLNRLTHNKDSRFFQYGKVNLTVLLTDLTTEDAGTYHCAVEDGELYNAFNLSLKEGDCCDSPPPIIGREGENIKIPCKHPMEVEAKPKHLCKQHVDFIESDLIGPKPFYKNSKYSLTHNKNGRGFNVTIQRLEQADVGTYWCGVRTGGENVALTRKVTLQIAEQGPAKEQKMPVFMVAVALVVAVTVFLCYRHRQSRKRDRTHRVMHHTTENPDPDSIYEEIGEIALPPRPLAMTTCACSTVDNTANHNYYTIQSPASFPNDHGLHPLSKTNDTLINTVYTTAQLPTQISSQLHTVLGESSGNIYSNSCLFTHDGTDTCRNISIANTDDAANNVYANTQALISSNDGPTICTDHPDPTKSVRHEPKNTSEDTVCKTSTHLSTRTSADTDCSIVSGPSSTKINTVYVTAELATDSVRQDLIVLVPTDLNNDAILRTDGKKNHCNCTTETILEETNHTSPLCIPPDTTNAELDTI